MAERSTAAVDVADNSGKEPLTAQAGKATADGADDRSQETAEKDAPNTGGERSGAEPAIATPELHSGHKLARRYRLEECITRLDGFSSWRAVDEKLRRAVGVHILPADHPRARSVLAAARSAALLADPRFVQVLDAVEENDLVYVVHEWLPDAVELTTLLAMGPLDAHDAYQLVDQVSQAMAASHREGLAHLRLTPGAVLRTSTGQYRIRGLAVNAALRGITTERPQRTDTEAIGALLYAALTQRWPYENDAHGLSGLPKGVGLLPPDQVKAGIHRGLSELAMRALVNDGATASRQEPPCTTPDELVKAVAAMPRIRPPEPTFSSPHEYRGPGYQQGAYGRTPLRPGPAISQPVPMPPAPLESGAGRALKWTVSALLIAALGIGSWQIADELLGRGNGRGGEQQSSTTEDDKKNKARPDVRTGKPLTIHSAVDFDPFGGDPTETPQEIGKSHDGDLATYWYSDWYASSDFGRLKSGLGIMLDLGSVQQVGKVDVSFPVGSTSVELRTAADSTGVRPTTFTAFSKVAEGAGMNVALTPREPVRSRYVLVWLTDLPRDIDGKFRGKVSEIKVTG
ncbi:protein kinase family protein [Streptomyces yaizuensis]|uniref:Serine/threonine protein kinase n=1 Tax=Streptomyces yaizuensis TaxID=2989713 RepID=A0ABQ5P2G5_9ACTN|nr:protein kinase family protein [Streptomyces sp. YSPA8]GLF96765.1 serine/threonine protein kinase [Streptomyces sp. YSPA8]